MKTMFDAMAKKLVIGHAEKGRSHSYYLEFSFQILYYGRVFQDTLILALIEEPSL
jgi:hypothetical protein